jgi:5-methylcytosine-specific restriction protein A
MLESKPLISVNPQPDLLPSVLDGRFGSGKSNVLAQYAALAQERAGLGGSAATRRAPLPDEITRTDLLQAIADLDAGTSHPFAASTGYDVLHEGRRYPPKAVVGLAATHRSGRLYGPEHFTGGRGSKCFRILEANGFTIVTKGKPPLYPDEIEQRTYTEGAGKTVTVNRYERDNDARAACIVHYGPCCQVCGFAFADRYGAIGEGFIHVHHIVPLSEIGREYLVDPIQDLRPVCPNCHAMLHKRTPAYSVEELRAMLLP